jgi:hypothetical protein
LFSGDDDDYDDDDAGTDRELSLQEHTCCIRRRWFFLTMTLALIHSSAAAVRTRTRWGNMPLSTGTCGLTFEAGGQLVVDALRLVSSRGDVFNDVKGNKTDCPDCSPCQFVLQP